MPPTAAQELDVEVRELEELQLRADVAPTSWDEADNSVEVVWTAGADVQRTDWASGTKYWERLDFSSDAVDLGRLNSGRAPVLDAHSDWSTRDVVGVVKAGSVRLDSISRTGAARLKFTRAPDAAPVVQRVKEGVLGSFSFGYKRTRIEQTAETRDGLPVWVVRRWEPFEISPVPIPADAGTGTRAASPAASSTPKNLCEIVRRSSETMPLETNTPTTTVLEDTAKLDAARKAAADQAIADERKRAESIRLAVRKAKLDDATADALVRDGKTIAEANAQILDQLAARDTATDTRSGVSVGRTDDEKVRGEFGDGLLLRVGRKVKDAGDLAKAFSGMRATRMAAFFLERGGVSTSMLSEAAIAQRAMSSSDFAQALANVQGKTLRMAYEDAPRTFEPFVRRVTANDFKPVSRVSMSGAPALSKVVEGAAIPNGQIVDNAQGYKLFKYGVTLAVTWETLINDDLDAIMRQGLLFGASVAALEGDLVYAIITSNQVMDEDSVAMLHSTHANTTTGVLSVANIATARGKLRKMTGPSGRALNIEGRLLLTGPDLEITARQYLAQIVPEAAGNANPLVDLLRGVIADTRLGATKWWLAGTPDQIDTIELASLAGVADIMVDTRTDFATKAVETSALAVRAAAAIDFRWIVESTGS